MEDWDAYSANPKNHTQTVLSMRFLTDPRISNAAKIVGAFLSVSDIRTANISEVVSFANGLTVNEICDAVADLCGYGFATCKELDDDFEISANYALFYGEWKEMQNGD